MFGSSRTSDSEEEITRGRADFNRDNPRSGFTTSEGNRAGSGHSTVEDFEPFREGHRDLDGPSIESRAIQFGPTFVPLQGSRYGVLEAEAIFARGRKMA